jgi:hypothetical protein
MDDEISLIQKLEKIVIDKEKTIKRNYPTTFICASGIKVMFREESYEDNDGYGSKGLCVTIKENHEDETSMSMRSMEDEWARKRLVELYTQLTGRR